LAIGYSWATEEAQGIAASHPEDPASVLCMSGSATIAANLGPTLIIIKAPNPDVDDFFGLTLDVRQWQNVGDRC
jgi:hypothetical protein